MDQRDFSFLYVASQEMIPHFYVLGFGVKNWVLCYTYDTGAITLKWDMGVFLNKVAHYVCDPKELRATTSCGNILCLGSGLSNIRCLQEDQDTKEEPKNWQVPEVDFLSNQHLAKSVSENP
jgi:hypothetical protein